MTWLIAVTLVVLAINVVVLVVNFRWLAKVRRASGDREALERLLGRGDESTS